MSVVGYRFEFDLSLSPSSSLSSVRVLLIRWARVSLKVEFDFPRASSGRLARTMSTRRRSLGKGKGRKGGDKYGVDGRVSGGVVGGGVMVWGWRGVLGKGSFGRE